MPSAHKDQGRVCDVEGALPFDQVAVCCHPNGSAHGVVRLTSFPAVVGTSSGAVGVRGDESLHVALQPIQRIRLVSGGERAESVDRRLREGDGRGLHRSFLAPAGRLGVTGSVSDREG